MANPFDTPTRPRRPSGNPFDAPARPKAAASVNPFDARPSQSSDLSSLEGLRSFAEQEGLGEQAAAIVDEVPKLSLLQRLGKGLGALNPAEALLTTAEEGLGAGVKKYVTGVAKGVASAITGTDYEGQRRYFADVAEKWG